MPPKEHTIGGVQWGALRAASDGVEFNVIIPAYFLRQHTAYLKGILESRLEGSAFGDIRLRLDPGDLLESNGVHYEPGSITLTGVTEPWPDADELRKLLEDAFAEAAEVNAVQNRKAAELERHLRAARGSE